MRLSLTCESGPRGASTRAYSTASPVSVSEAFVGIGESLNMARFFPHALHDTRLNRSSHEHVRMRKVPKRKETGSGANQRLSRAGRRYYLLYEVD